MAKYCLKKPSKRLASAKRFKIEKKVKEHNRKMKKEAKKKAVGKRKSQVKPINVPNKCPFKEEVLIEAEKARDDIQARKQSAKETAQKARLEKKAVGMKRKATDALKDLTKEAQKRVEAFESKEMTEAVEGKERTCLDDKTMQAYAGEVRKTIAMADIVIEVLDARDPLGSRCSEVEKWVLQAGKRLVLLLNKIDLVPRDNVKSWLAYLRMQLPTIAFRASTQEQNQKLGRAHEAAFGERGSKCVGADMVMKLLANYCRNKDIKTSIRVGIIGYPNVGKSSVINSLKRKRACNVGAQPGITRQIQEIELDKHIRLLDCPGVVLAVKSSVDAIEMSLKNAIKVDNILDPVAPVQAILRRCKRETLMLHYTVPEFDSCETFLALVARKLGRLKKGARPDIGAAAKQVLNDWNSGKLRYHTEPPTNDESTAVTSENKQFCSAELLGEFTKEFDLEALEDEQKVIVEGLPANSTMETDVLYQKDIPIESEETEDKMDDDAESQQQFILTDAKKSKKATAEQVKQVLPESLKITGNVQLNSCIKKAMKKQKKKNKKFVKKADALADSMDAAMIEDKQEDFNFDTLDLA